MLPKDLLVHLEKGNRTVEVLKTPKHTITEATAWNNVFENIGWQQAQQTEG